MNGGAVALDLAAVDAALAEEAPGEEALAALLSPAADARLEEMAVRAEALTARHFGRGVQLYVPLYLSNHCSNGCAYCGFASDRPVQRRCLTLDEACREMDRLQEMGLEDVLLLTGERSSDAGFDYLLEAVRKAAERFESVSVESFPMETNEYAGLADAGCVGVTIYQETYDRSVYAAMHRWGPKTSYEYRLGTAERALAGGIRFVGLGALLGLAEPVGEMLNLYRHARRLQSIWWRAGISLSFPRLRPQRGDFTAPHPVDDRTLARILLGLRICLPEVPLVLSTREPARLRDGFAGLVVNRMSVASRTTVGGYATGDGGGTGQFDVSDDRTVEEFCDALRGRGLEPVFKAWDRAYRATGTGTEGPSQAATIPLQVTGSAIRRA